MARQEADREDLMQEATAMVHRVELALPDEREHLIAGLRRNAALSLYFGPDRVYQFDAAGRLRRAFIDGKLFRSQGETLAQLVRHRTSSQTQLRRHDLDESELQQLCETMQTRLTKLVATLDAGRVRLVQAVPESTVLADTLADKVRHILDAAPWLARPIAFRD